MTKDNIATDIEERKFKSNLLHELDRIASAVERLASCESAFKKQIDSSNNESDKVD